MSKLIIDNVRKFVTDLNYTLLSNEISNSKSKIQLLCPNGHLVETSWNIFQQGKKRCLKCIDRRGTTQGFSIEYVADFFTKSGCTLLSKEYKNSNTSLEYMCECGNVSFINFSNFKKGQRCRNCRYKKMAKTRLTPYYEIVKLFDQEGCTLLTLEEEYSSVTNKIEYICLCGNRSTVTIHNFKNGKRCAQCKVSRRIKTLYENESAPCSMQQKYVHSLIGGELNYPQHNSSLDIAFPDEKIYVECDFGGHWLQVIFGNITQDEFIKKERARSYALLKRGWKEIRIISKSDKLPSNLMICEMIKYAKEYLENDRHHIKFFIDEGTVVSSQFNRPYDYGILRRICKTDLIELQNQIIA